VSPSANPYAPPRAALDTQPADEYWREGKVLVMRVGSALPPRCVRCNQPAVQPTKSRWLYWHHPGWFLLILINVLIYVLVALAVRRKAKVAVGLCAKHRQRRRVFLSIGWGGFALGLAIIFSQLSGESAAGLGMLIILFAAIVGIVGSRVAYPSRITKEEVRLKGCGAPFLDSVRSR